MLLLALGKGHDSEGVSDPHRPVPLMADSFPKKTVDWETRFYFIISSNSSCKSALFPGRERGAEGEDFPQKTRRVDQALSVTILVATTSAEAPIPGWVNSGWVGSGNGFPGPLAGLTPNVCAVNPPLLEGVFIKLINGTWFQPLGYGRAEEGARFTVSGQRNRSRSSSLCRRGVMPSSAFCQRRPNSRSKAAASLGCLITSRVSSF